jgi:hypothetical protein
VVRAEPRRRDSIDAVVVPQVDEQLFASRPMLMVQPRRECHEVNERLGVALTTLLRVTPNDSLELGVLGHRQASS